jgi:hypothetical protein
MTNYNPGDLVKINGDDGEWYAEVVGITEEYDLEIFYLNRGKGRTEKWVWKYDEEWQTVSPESVSEHIPLEKGKALECFKKLGFRPLTENTFVKLSDTIPDDVILPIGFEADEDDVSDDSMDDFIVPDEEGEPFSPADPSIPFVAETHELVHKYNKWQPKNNGEVKLKVFVDNISHKYKLKDDERQFVKGKSVDYDHPPLKKRKSSNK